jgi:transcriptional regulator with PAS, ATPase and Fis domain
MDKWTEGMQAAMTVCDENGKVLYLNEKAAQTFAKNGGKALVGTNLMDCHPEPARSKVKDLLANPRYNAYTIEKNGIKKLIYQTPWYENGKFCGYVELSMEIPFEMPHHVRKPKTS